VAAVLLATPLDVAARLGRDLTQAELLRLPALLQDASAKVRNYTGRTFTQAETTVRLRVNNGRVKLPQRPVVSITSVKMLNRDGTVGTTLAGWFWDGLAEIATASPSQIANGPWFPNDRYRIVEVTYTHGYSTVPADVLAVVCSIATRALGRKPEDAGLTSESIGGGDYTYTVGSAGAAGPLGMLPDERDALDVYRQQAGVTWMRT
jgi:hypothetical protein